MFGADAVRAGVRYERFLDYGWLLGTIAKLLALVVMVRRGPRLARSLGLGRVNAGLITGVVVMTVLWAVSLPFGFATGWWERRHGISTENWGTIIFSPWERAPEHARSARPSCLRSCCCSRSGLRGTGGSARRRSCSLSPSSSSSRLPYANRIGTHPIRSPQLAAAVERLEAREHAGDPAVRIQQVHDQTTAANAYAIGIGPSSSVFIWDTMLDGRFTPGEVRFVVGHELAHLARLHLWKGIAWGALIGIPLARGRCLSSTRRRGGLP